MTKTSDFTLTIPGLTLDQLTAIAAYADGLKVNGNVKTMATDKPAPAPTPTPQPAATMTPARDLPDMGHSRAYPTNADGTLKVTGAGGNTEPAPTPTPTPTPAAMGNAASLAASNVADADRDAFGVPYHSSFHADRGGKTKGRNNDGSWKMKKNVDRDAYNQYRAQFATFDPAAPHSAPLATSQPVAPVPTPTPAQINAQFAPGVPPQGATIPAPAPLGAPAPMVAPLAAPAPALEPVTYDQLIALYNEVCQSGAVTQDQLNAIHAEAQADPTSLDYANHADKRALAYARLAAFRVPVAA